MNHSPQMQTYHIHSDLEVVVGRLHLKANLEKLTWPIDFFSKFKSPGPDEIFPGLLQGGQEPIKGLVQVLFGIVLVLGYFLKPWRTKRVVFILKPENQTTLSS